MSIATDIKKEYEAQIKEAGFFDYDKITSEIHDAYGVSVGHDWGGQEEIILADGSVIVIDFYEETLTTYESE